MHCDNEENMSFVSCSTNMQCRVSRTGSADMISGFATTMREVASFVWNGNNRSLVEKQVIKKATKSRSCLVELILVDTCPCNIRSRYG